MCFFTRLKGSILLFPIVLVALVVGGVFGAPAALAARAVPFAGFYQQTNLVSDMSGMAPTTDPNLKNPWGLSHSPTGPWWVSDNNAGFATVYNGNGTPVNPIAPGTPVLVVTIPLPGGGPGGAPTGNVFNPVNSTNPDDFVVSENGKSGPSIFMFATEDGTISGWNPNVDKANAIIAVDRSTVGQGAVYKGLAIGRRGNNELIYATNFRFGTIEAFNRKFKLVRSFTD